MHAVCGGVACIASSIYIFSTYSSQTVDWTSPASFSSCGCAWKRRKLFSGPRVLFFSTRLLLIGYGTNGSLLFTVSGLYFHPGFRFCRRPAELKNSYNSHTRAKPNDVAIKMKTERKAITVEEEEKIDTAQKKNCPCLLNESQVFCMSLFRRCNFTESFFFLFCFAHQTEYATRWLLTELSLCLHTKGNNRQKWTRLANKFRFLYFLCLFRRSRKTWRRPSRSLPINLR